MKFPKFAVWALNTVVFFMYYIVIAFAATMVAMIFVRFPLPIDSSNALYGTSLLIVIVLSLLMNDKMYIKSIAKEEEEDIV